MKRTRRIVATSILSILIGLGAAAPANAVTEYVGGGTWVHYMNCTYSHSNYYHATKTHKSTVRTPNGSDTSGWVIRGRWAYASIEKAPWGNRAFYNYR